ncbi:MAG: ABC transporter ATP-binding protein [Lachnospiraceae bacterium]
MLEVRKLNKSFAVSGAEHKVIVDLSFSVHDGEFYMIVGQSGCGKSTLLRMMGGFEQPDGGIILLNEKRVESPSRDMMMVFQNFDQLFPWFTLKRNLTYAVKKARLEVPGHDYDGYVMEYLRLAGLEEFKNSYPHQLSGGMKQRGALARALCLKPGILLMDEPFSSLDYITKQGLYQSVRDMTQRTGATVVMVTHDIGEALLLGTSIGVLSKETGQFTAVYQRGDGFDAGLREQLEASLGQPCIR